MNSLIFTDAIVFDALEPQQGRFTWDNVRTERSLSHGALEAFHDFAKFNYECGDYTTAEAAIAAYLQLTGGASASAGGSTSATSVSALWLVLQSCVVNLNLLLSPLQPGLIFSSRIF